MKNMDFLLPRPSDPNFVLERDTYMAYRKKYAKHCHWRPLQLQASRSTSNIKSAPL